MSAASPAAARLHRPTHWVLLAGGGLFALIIVVLGALAGAGGQSQPSDVAVADIPTTYLVDYEQAGLRFGIDWAVLAAIGKVECDHGRSDAPGCNPPGSVNSAGATGPMQFIGSTWRVGTPAMTVPAPGPPVVGLGGGYATDGDGDGIANVWDPADAIASAARFLRENGAPQDYRAALLAYDDSPGYAAKVLTQAAEYRSDFAPGATGGALRALSWAVAHVGTFSGYSQGATTDRGGSVSDMQTSEPSGTCDCSMFARWAMAQAGVDIGLTTVQQWYANGLLPNTDEPASTPVVSRGVGPDPPPGGYRPGDLIFFGHGPGDEGHVALWLGDGLIVHCSASDNGSAIRPLAGYVLPTGWVRWNLG